MDRIPLTDEDIQFNDDGYAFYDVGGYNIQHQFKQQILVDHKFYYKFHNENVYSFTEEEFKELTEKAGKYHLFNFHKDHLAVLNALHDEVQQNKQLKEEILSDKVSYNLLNVQYDNLKEKLKVHGLHQIDEYVSLKEKLSKVKEVQIRMENFVRGTDFVWAFWKIRDELKAIIEEKQ